MEVRDRILAGDLKDHIKEGIMIIGPNTLDGGLTTWHCSSIEEAERLASRWAATDGGIYEIIEYKFIGVIRPINYPVEFAKPPQTSKQ